MRTIAGNFQVFAREPWLLDPRRNRLWVQTGTHKGLRLLTPFLLATVLLGSLLIQDPWISPAALAAQAAFYAAALVGYARRGDRRRTPLITVPYVTCLLAAATLVALARFTIGSQTVTWQKSGAAVDAGAEPARP